MEEENNIINCTRCGAIMDKNSRYCMKCGNLNYNHEANAKMKKYIDKPKDQMYEYNSMNDAFKVNTYNKETNNMSIANNTGSMFMCFIFNILVYIVIIGVLSFYYYNQSLNNINMLLISKFPYYCIGVSLLFIFNYSVELIFMKSNHRWWESFIPIWNYFVLSDIVFNKMLYGILLFIPIVNVIYMIVLLYKLGDVFARSGILTVLFPYFYIPVIGLGVSRYQKIQYVFSNDSKYTERQYLYNKIILGLNILVILVSIGCIGYVNKDSIKNVNIQNEYYVMIAKKMVNVTKNKINDDRYECPTGKVDGKSSYNFVFDDVGNYMYLPLYDTRDEIVEGYVKVDYSSGNPVYYVTLTDGTYGFKEIEISTVTKDSVVRYKNDYSTYTNDWCSLRDN